MDVDVAMNVEIIESLLNVSGNVKKRLCVSVNYVNVKGNLKASVDKI